MLTVPGGAPHVCALATPRGKAHSADASIDLRSEKSPTQGCDPGRAPGMALASLGNTRAGHSTCEGNARSYFGGCRPGERSHSSMDAAVSACPSQIFGDAWNFQLRQIPVANPVRKSAPLAH